MSMPDDLSFTPVGYEPMEAVWWPVIAASIPKPWPREAAMMDLRWWSGQEAATRSLQMRRVATMPGRPALAARWGWTDWAVKSLLRAEPEWADPLRETSASAPPALRQPAASEPPAAERSNADNTQESASAPPALRQPAASEPPRARVDTGPPITEAPITDQGSATADPLPSTPEKRKSSKTTKRNAKSDPHPCHQRVIDAWDRVWRKTRSEIHQDPPYPWTPRDIAILAKQIRDPYVSRDPSKYDADMQRLGAAINRYLSQSVDGTYVKGLTIKGFAADVPRWFSSVDAAIPIRRGPATFESLQDILTAAKTVGNDPGPTHPPKRVIIDITGA